MSFVDWLPLGSAVEGVMAVPCARGNTEIVPSWNISSMHIMVKDKREIALPFLYPVELIIASGAGEKKGKELHWVTESLLGFTETEKDFPSISEGNGHINRLIIEMSSACAEGWRKENSFS